ncbi:MAG: type IV toxin-antitoxin system AbiEi family antitoxin domain-containing protein [Patescibacteria group bacterium]|jgi:predicted transcriptional regulator of viral defense system
MKTLKASQILQKSGKSVFSTTEIKNLLEIEKDNTAYKKIEALVETKVLQRAKRGFYILAGKEPSDFELANHLYQPSYISLASALNAYGIMVQTPYEIASVTTKTAQKIIFENKTFSYFHLDKKYFWGYKKEDNALIASPEKALMDAIFFASLGKASYNFDEFDLQIINKEKFQNFSEKIALPAYHKLKKQLGL